VGSGSAKDYLGKGFYRNMGKDLVDCRALFSHHINIIVYCVLWSAGVVVDAFCIPHREQQQTCKQQQNHQQQQLRRCTL
jgi:hypothetical protein